MVQEPPGRERLYESLKAAVVNGMFRHGERIDVLKAADRHRVSVTPVREVLFQLIGERLVDPHPDGGFRAAVPDAAALAHLYAWNGHLLLAAIHLLPEPVVLRAVRTISAPLATSSSAPVPDLTARVFLALGEATGNPEFGAQITSANDRLRRARLAEEKLFADDRRELRSLVRTDGLDVKKNVRRRLLAYHRRRIERAAQIEALIA